MTDHTDIPHRLKALRVRARLSVREIARRVNISPSGYLHEESSDRFKESVLPVPQARLFAAALSGTSVDASEVMALTGTSAPHLASHIPEIPQGFSDAATPFTFQEQPVTVGSSQPTLRAIFGNSAQTPATYRIEVDLPAFGLIAGDVIIVDLGRLPTPGELAIVSLFDDDSASSTTSLHRFLPPYLQSGTINPSDALLRIDQPGVTVRYPVIGSLRGVPRD